MTREIDMSVPAQNTKRRPGGSMFLLQRELVVPATRDEVFSFFADAFNLNRLTPPFLQFRVLSPRPVEMKAGTRIEYALRLHGVPLRWESEIMAWEPPERFVDLQIRGPYRWWHHEHRFEDQGDSTRVIDEVEYACPGGRWVNALFVRRDVERIFEFRQEQLAAIFARAPQEVSHS
jgi:ligand-binding SRPBCC domain-containing protein